MNSMGEEESERAGVVKLTPLSHWMAFTIAPNCVRTYEKKFANVDKVSDLTRREKVHR